ncbi:hypothetical protein [Cutibacterium namnetense]|uniref:Conserved domain protein n=1 Tax=[Propionibacterium] namnetense SK182B-JCVI TaxID=1051006 RepID=F9NYC3_9ACTN|nr:hypothetical protein [Cutibacterium namnetense]EGR92640.1 conserved domain protein [ [[Propionibacterium] namnetense SK182B-JCVI]
MGRAGVAPWRGDVEAVRRFPGDCRLRDGVECGFGEAVGIGADELVVGDEAADELVDATASAGTADCFSSLVHPVAATATAAARTQATPRMIRPPA